MKNLNTDIKVGLFIILGFVSLFYMSFMMGSLSLNGKKVQDRFYIYFNTVSGIAKKSKVRLQGVTIGEVGDILLERHRVRISVYLDSPQKIPIDSTANIQTSGLMGDRYINIMPGKELTMLKNEDVLEDSIDPVSMDEIMAKLSVALDDVKKFAEGLSGMFDDEGILGDNGIFGKNGMFSEGGMFGKDGMLGGGKESTLASILNNVDKSTELVRLMLEENRANIKHGFNNMRSMTGHLDSVIVENRNNFTETMSNLKSGSERLDKIMLNMESVSAKIDNGQGTIGKLVNDDSVYDGINDTLIGAQDLIGGGKGMINKVDNIRVGLGLRAEQQSDIGKAKSYFSLKIQPREDKFYLLEITEDTRRKDLAARNTLNSLLYTLLINKRYGDVGLKAGLMESSGGVGLDFYAYRDSLQLSAELFNFSGYDVNAEKPQLKITGKYFLQKYVYLYVGGDEILNKYYQTFFGGLGIMVDEEDLKFFFSLL